MSCVPCISVFGRKLIEGEDSRLSSMVQSLTISASSASLAVGSTPDVASPTMLAMGTRGRDDLGGAPGNGSDVTVEVMSSESQTESYAEELTERKTVLIRYEP